MSSFFADPLFVTALAGALALACGAAPLGVLLIGRRMSLVGDSLSHATLPGAAVAYVLCGPDPWMLTLGALIAGVIVAVSSAWLSRVGRMPEDAAFAVLYLSALAIGIVILGRTASAEVVHSLLFGDARALDGPGLTLAVIAALCTLFALVLGSKRLESAADESAGGHDAWTGLAQALLMGLVAVNLVAGFRAFGALMTVGLMMVPAAAARFWSLTFKGRMIAAVAISAASSAAGLIGAHGFSVEPGPAMVLSAAALFGASLIMGPARRRLQTDA
ncbi:MAG: metal ABC transporter permease [Proteobacteria bacterium]|nr:metal ABC transporter permease [Pseudomonadota bacterium]